MGKIKIESKGQTGGITAHTVNVAEQNNTTNNNPPQPPQTSGFIEMLKNWWWKILIPLAIGLFVLFANKREWFKPAEPGNKDSIVNAINK